MGAGLLPRYGVQDQSQHLFTSAICKQVLTAKKYFNLESACSDLSIALCDDDTNKYFFSNFQYYQWFCFTSQGRA